MPTPIPESSTITYQVPRDVLVRIWWRRMVCRPRLLIGMTIFAVMGIGCIMMRLFAGGDTGFLYCGSGLLFLIIVAPLNIYRVLAKAVDDNAQFTDRKVVEFSQTKLIITGPNWKSELPWSHFLGFTEDANYVYMPLSKNGIASVVPKSAFTPDQLESFRVYAKAGTRNSAR